MPTSGVDRTPAVKSQAGLCLCFTVSTDDAASVPAARAKVADQLRLWGLPRTDDLVHTVLLVVSELVTNCVQHAARRSPIADVRIGLDDEQVTVAIHDRHPALPRPAEVPHLDGSGGWGLRLVEALTAEAGGSTTVRADSTGRGKTVSVRLPLRQRHTTAGP